MEIDVRVEEAMPITRLAKVLPDKPHRDTLRRWIVDGRMRHHDRKRIRMAKVYLPSGLGSSREAYFRFLEALNS